MYFARQLIQTTATRQVEEERVMAAINSVAELTREGDIAVLTINSPPVNALSADVRDGLRDGVGQAAADPAVKAIVLICAGRTFIAGADISEFGKPPEGRHACPKCKPQSRTPEAGHRRHARHGARRRLRGRAGLPLPRRRALGQIWPAGDQARPHSRRRRHAAPAAPDRRREGARRHPVGNAVRRRAGARNGASSTRSPRRASCARARSPSPARSSTEKVPLQQGARPRRQDRRRRAASRRSSRRSARPTRGNSAASRPGRRRSGRCRTRSTCRSTRA